MNCELPASFTVLTRAFIYYKSNVIMIKPITIVLASQSENRKQLLSSLGVSFIVAPSRINEENVHAKTPEKLAQAIARAKAQAVASRMHGIIIAADSFLMHAGLQYQKPKTLDEAKAMLRQFSGKTSHILTGVHIINTYEQREVSNVNKLSVQCIELSEERIAEYVATRPVMEWAGAHNPLDPVSASIFLPIGKMKYKREYYGIGIETVAEELRRVGVPFDISTALASLDKTER